MILLLLFSFFWEGGFGWEEVESYDAKSITRQIKNSSVVESYGKGILQKSLTYFDGDIFEAGDKLVIPEGANILRIPAGLKISKTDIDIVKHDRYAVEYEEGALKDEWERLKRRSALEMGVSSLDNLTVEQISEAISRTNSENMGIGKSKRGNIVVNGYPQKIYISFILIEIDGQRKLLPLVLAISPIQKLLDNAEGI